MGATVGATVSVGGSDTLGSVTTGTVGMAMDGSRLVPGTGVIGVLTNGVDCGATVVHADRATATRANKASFVKRTCSLLRD
jgi:hypothetical protein